MGLDTGDLDNEDTRDLHPRFSSVSNRHLPIVIKSQHKFYSCFDIASKLV